MTTKTEKPAYMQAALAKQKIDKMRAGHVEKLKQAADDAVAKENAFVAGLPADVREIFDALDGAE